MSPTLFHVMIGISGISLISFSTLASATVQTPPPVVITGSLDQESITTSKNVVVTINLTNMGDIPASGLDVQVISPGLTVISEKEWPENLYPTSSLIGQYILQSSYEGTFPISVSTTYTLNDTRSSPPIITQMVSQQELGVVSVKSDPLFSWSTAWAGAPTTVLGAAVGFLITKLSDHFTSKQIEGRDKKSKTDLAKSYVLNFLEVNQKKVQDGQFPLLRTWESIEPVYEFIPTGLREGIRNLYLDLDVYSGDRENMIRRGEICSRITSLLETAKGWHT
jgi:hypothetical protein